MVQFPEQQAILKYKYPLRSRYGETDKMGYVYYGRYLEYFEAARTEMIRSMGVSYSRLEEDGIMLPVIYSQISYKAPVFYDELMQIEVLIFDVPAIRLKTYYNVYTNRLKEPHIQGQVDLCFTNSDTRKPCKAPDYFLDLYSENK